MQELGADESEASERSDKRVVIIGAGPAGLTAAYQLCKLGIRSVVLEKDPVVGGLSRTVHHKGYHVDIGGHRFFTKVDAVERLWHEILPDGEFLERRRLSRIYYDRKFFSYPLRARNALFGLGAWNSVRILVSYLRARIAPIRTEVSLEDWVSNRFGRRLYDIFFKSYTEKIWGVPGSKLSADWAAQRIRGLSLTTAVKNALLARPGSKSRVIPSLIGSFHYPKRGPGMLWERAASLVQQNGCELRKGACVERVLYDGSRVAAVELSHNGTTERVTGTHFISTMPARDLVLNSWPQPPSQVLEAAHKLSYRDFLTVALVVDRAELFPDNWIYVHDPNVRVGRVQNFKNWSPHMVPDPGKTCLGLEYFCFEGDGLWSMTDEDLIELATNEMQTLGLLSADEVTDAVVVRMPKAYPVYDGEYRRALETIRGFLDGIDNLYLVGRNGMHKYNNQDHSMLTAMLAVENINGANHDIWAVNVDPEYHEEIGDDKSTSDTARLAATQPHVPGLVNESPQTTAAIRWVFARLHKAALATATGTVAGLYVLLATVWALILGTDQLRFYLGLLSQYFVGYTVSLGGALLGFAYGFCWGFVLGWMVAYLRNLTLGVYLQHIRRRANVESEINFLDYV